MKSGDFALVLALGSCLVALGGYGGVVAGWEKARRLARFAFALMSAAIVIAVALLFHFILTHRFDLYYVWSYSSTDLPGPYLVSTFWAGQEGTFLLWAGYGSLIGLMLRECARKWEAPVMMGFCLVQAELLVLLLLRSPFAPTSGQVNLSHLSPEMLAAPGYPREGNGLNPLLQNPWMALHPPVLFLGFASLAVPFTFALAALGRRDYEGWIRPVLPWTRFAWVTLGMGIVSGGYWAYETLGWGGYWGWDPVENSSLVPWLFTTALLHGLLLQRASGGFRRANFCLALAAFGTVLYGSYLNRSGILADFSVHSFGELGRGFNAALIGFFALPTIVALALFLRRSREIGSSPGSHRVGSRSFAVYLAVLLLVCSGLLVLGGNSAPLLTGALAAIGRRVPLLAPFLPSQARGVEPSFYNLTHTPLAMLLAVLLGGGMLLDWRGGNGQRIRRAGRGPGVFAGVGAVLMTLLVVRFHSSHLPSAGQIPPSAKSLATVWVVFVTLALFALAVNFGWLCRLLVSGRGKRAGASLAHIGLMLLFVGVIASSVYEQKVRLELPLRQPVERLGYTFIYEGRRERPDGKVELKVRLTANGTTCLLQPRMWPTKEGLVRQPAIARQLTHDLYLEPEEVTSRRRHHLVLQRGERKQVEGWTLEFVRFEMPREGMNGHLWVGAVVRMLQRGREYFVTPVLSYRHGFPRHLPVELPPGWQLTLVQVAVEGPEDEPHIVLHLAQPTVVVWATRKPLMGSVWLGCGLLLGGGLLALGRRACKAAQVAEASPLPTSAGEPVST